MRSIKEVVVTDEAVIAALCELKSERDELLEALAELEEACNSSQVATIYDASCRVRARELIEKIRGEE